MKTTLSILAVAAALGACSPSKDKEAQDALNRFAQYVDSVDRMNTEWKSTNDTDYVEYPISPEDPTITRLDTIVTAAKDKAPSILHIEYLKTGILDGYEKVKSEAESKLEKMDDKMKREYEATKEKFEALSK